MPIRYFIDLNCVPREELGADGLVAMLATFERAEMMRARFLQQYNVDDESRMKFKERVISGGSGDTTTRERSVAELREETAPLDALAHHCAGCPAALTGQPFSCTQAVGFPISLAAQQWLVNQLPEAGSESLDLFRTAVASHGYGNSPNLKLWRSAGILEGDKAATAQRGQETFTSDQLITELFLVGDLMPDHALGVLLHTQTLASSDGRTGDALLNMIQQVQETSSTEDAPTIEYALPADDADDESIRQLKQFLFALYTALSLQLPLGVRV